jgi:AraC-like DNA-binding protein
MYEDIKYVSSGKFISKAEWIHQSRIINSHELILVLDGCVHIEIGGKAYDLERGDVVHIAPGVHHSGTDVSLKTVSFYWIHYTGDSPPLPQFMKLRNSSRTEILCKQLLHCSNDFAYPPECSDSFVKIILMELIAESNLSDKNENVLISAVEEWIRGMSENQLRVTDVASHFGFNADYINRGFKRYHPEGLKAYIDLVRCQKIRYDLSSSDLTLKEISNKYNFLTYKYFLKYFKLHEGVTPTEFRNAYYITHINRT